MANAVYDVARQKYLEGTAALGWLSNNIKVVLVDTALYTVDLVLDDFLDDIAVGARVATSPNLASKTTVAGVADADDVTFASVSGATSEALVIYSDSGVESTSPLILFVDSAVGLPVTPGGGDILVRWDTGSNRIFKL